MRDRGQSACRPWIRGREIREEKRRGEKFYFEIQQSGKIIANNLFDSPGTWRVMVKIENKKKGEEKKIKLYNKIGEEARVILSIRENGRKTGIILYINVV